MLRKHELLGDLRKLLVLNVAQKNWQKDTATSIHEKRNIPIETLIDILTQRTDIEDYNEFTLFCIAEACNLKHGLDYYFTQSEINDFNHYVLKTTEVKFPYKFEVIEVVENSQYIGKTSVKELIRLRDAQLINYNENAQRTLKRMKAEGGIEISSIDLNRKAVNEIMHDLTTGEFIPNTLTFGISPDTDFEYNKESRTLIIKDKIRFDILDGYHRYIALSNKYNLDNRFDYPMELRLVVFPETKARHFIFQEDKKTKMRKIDSDALSATDPANEVCAKIKNKLAGNILVARNNGIIDESVLSEMIRCLCIKSGAKYDNKIKNRISDDFVNAVLIGEDTFNTIDLKAKWSVSLTVAFALLVYTFRLNEKLLISIDKTIREKKLITGKTVNRTVINRIRKEVLV